MKRRIPLIIAHAAIILVLMLLTLLIIDYINPTMDFINNNMTKAMIGALCLLGMLQACMLIAVYRRK